MEPTAELKAAPTGSQVAAHRTAALVGNRMALVGALLFLAEFVGIIASQVHTMPGLPGDSLADVTRMYDGQRSATGFLVGWYAFVLPGRLLFALALRRALLDSDRSGRVNHTVLSWSVGLVGLGVAVEMVSATVLAGAAASSARGDADVAFGLDRVAHYLQVQVACPSMIGFAILGVAMWRSSVFPRVIAGGIVVLGTVEALSGALLSGPGNASLQDDLTILNLVVMLLTLWTSILLFVRSPRG